MGTQTLVTRARRHARIKTPGWSVVYVSTHIKSVAAKAD
jgi:hypothetical protein